MKGIRFVRGRPVMRTPTAYDQPGRQIAVGAGPSDLPADAPHGCRQGHHRHHRHHERNDVEHHEPHPPADRTEPAFFLDTPAHRSSESWSSLGWTGPTARRAAAAGNVVSRSRPTARSSGLSTCVSTSTSRTRRQAYASRFIHGRLAASCCGPSAQPSSSSSQRASITSNTPPTFTATGAGPQPSRRSGRLRARPCGATNGNSPAAPRLLTAPRADHVYGDASRRPAPYLRPVRGAS
jgi:hypothetical protein